MVLKLKGAEKIFFNPEEDSPEDFGLTQEQLSVYMMQGGIPVRYDEFETTLVVKNTDMEAAYVDSDGVIKLFTKSGSEFAVVEQGNTFARIKEIIEFDGSDEPI